MSLNPPPKKKVRTINLGPSELERLPRNMKRFSKSELQQDDKNRDIRWKQLLISARKNDMKSVLMLPCLDSTQPPMLKVHLTIQDKVDLLDVYNYLLLRQRDIPHTISYSNFGWIIGRDIPKTTIHTMVKREDDYRVAVKVYPPNARHITTRKNLEVEHLLLKWIENQRYQNIPVSGNMIRKAANQVYFVLADSHHDDDEASSEIEPSFSVSWFAGFKKHHGISHCKLHGEIASVDLEAIEPELKALREICSKYKPENIYNCDETGMYLKEQRTQSYTTVKTNEGAKAVRDCRVSIMFCINATGSSIELSEKMTALQPFVIGSSFARGVE